jgi:membrane protein involved in colicin uptake
MARTAKAKADSEKTSTKSVAASQENEETVGNAAVEEPVTEQKEKTEEPAEAPKKKRAASPKKKAAAPKAKPEAEAEVKPEESPAPEEKIGEEPEAEASKAEAPAEKAEEKPKRASTKKSDTTKKPARAASTKKADADKVEEIYVQFNGQEITTKDILEKVKQAHKDNGHRIGHIKSTQIYIKPEDGMAYYVINGKYKGEIPLSE